MNILSDIVTSREESSAENNNLNKDVNEPQASIENIEQQEENTDPIKEEVITNQEQEIVNEEKPKSKFATEEVARIDAYLRKYPEKSLDDYKALMTPVESLQEDDLIKSYLAEKAGKTKSQIEYTLKQLELKEIDPDFDGEFENNESTLENLKKKGDREELIQKAREWREEYVKNELNFDIENQTAQGNENEASLSIEQFIESAKEQQQQYTQNYRTKIYEALPTLEKIELDVQGKTISFVPDENFKLEMRKGAEDISQIGNEYFDEQSNIKDAKGFIINNTLWANPKTRQPMIDFMIEQAILNDRASNDKMRRNITLDDASGKSIPQSSERGDVVDRILTGSRNRSF